MAIIEPVSNTLNRQEFANSLDRIVKEIHKGVIAIDAEWGQGKTFFVKKWMEASSSKDGMPPIKYFDVFRAEYLQDPFVAASAAVYQACQSESADSGKLLRVREKAANIAKSLAGRSAKRIISLASGNIVKDDDIQKVWDSIEQVEQSEIEEQISSYQARVDEIETFKNELSSAIASLESERVILVVDELDRCNPKYSLRFLEVLQHYFEIDKLLIILVLNINQLERHVEKISNCNREARNYLSKFIQAVIKLPKSESYRSAYSKQYMGLLVQNQGISGLDRIEEQELFSELAEVFGCSLRQVERVIGAFRIYAISVGNVHEGHFSLAAVLTFLSILHPSLLENIRERKIKIEQLDEFLRNSTRFFVLRTESKLANYAINWLRLVLARPSSKSDLPGDESLRALFDERYSSSPKGELLENVIDRLKLIAT